MTSAEILTVAPAMITNWRNLQDTAGESIETDWPTFFATFAEPGKYRGDLAHPGWSPCACEPAVRADANVCGMSALVLDYDSGTTVADACDVWGSHFGFVHTSRKHKPDAPRFRVILPFRRIVTPDEYVILWRWAQKIASGANQRIDPATKNVSRFWYMPARTEHYETRRLTGEPIDPDPILAAHSYEETERSRVREPRASTTDIEKRASRYLARMPEAISGSGGHQALWSAALAMVRGFRLSPEQAFSILVREYNPRCKPQWNEKEIRHKVNDAEKDATTPYGYLADKVRAVPQPAPPPDDDWTPPEVPGDLIDDPEPARPSTPSVSVSWRAQLSTTPQGHVRNTFDNICRVLEHHEAYAEKLTYDEMRLTPLLSDRPVNDADVGRIRREIEQNFGFQPSESNVRAAIGVVSDARKFHPVRRYLTSLAWDGEKRIERVVGDILGATNNELHRAFVNKWFVSATARALRPGCKVDNSLVLVGRQRARKSTFFSILGGEWFADTHMDITDKDGLLQLHSAWIYEWAEIEAITTQKHASSVKAFASSSKDTFRTPFGRTTEVHPRSTVIVGTTNETQFLVDPTGHRRFWVVTVGDRINVDLLAEWRDQLWAEAVALYGSGRHDGVTGEAWFLSDKQEDEQAIHSAAFEVEDAWGSIIEKWLRGQPSSVTTADILTDAIKMLPGHISRGAEMRVGSVMRRLGYTNHRVREGRSTLRVWKKDGSDGAGQP